MSIISDIAKLLGTEPSASASRLHEDLLTSLLVMAWMVEARDPYTGGHLWRVSRFSHLAGRVAGGRTHGRV